jgi:ethanolamine utilization protein EutN
MMRGRVIDRVWATKRVEGLPSGAVLEVALDNGGKLLAFDPLGCGPGEQVMVTTGSVAAAWLGGGRTPIDALIIGSIDEEPAAARRSK